MAVATNATPFSDACVIGVFGRRRQTSPRLPCFFAWRAIYGTSLAIDLVSYLPGSFRPAADPTLIAMLYRAHLNAPDVSPGISFSVPATQIWPGDELSLAAHREQPVAGIVVCGSPIRLTLAV